MTDIILAFIPFAAAVAFFIRARAEMKARRQAERRLADLDTRLASLDAHQREWLATLAHELRTPLAAILGYAELLEDGLFGTLDHRGIDAIARIRAVADQMLHLADGMDRFAAVRENGTEDIQNVPGAALVDGAVHALRVDAEARGVTLDLDPAEALFATRPRDAQRALHLALGAAIKATPGGHVLLGAEPGAVPALTISHTRLDPLRDDYDRVLENTPERHAPRLTGPGLRLAMARRIAASLDGRLTLHATGNGCTVRLELPRLGQAAPDRASD